MSFVWSPLGLQTVESRYQAKGEQAKLARTQERLFIRNPLFLLNPELGEADKFFRVSTK